MENLTAEQKLEAKIEAQTTVQLFAALDMLEGQVTGHFNAGLSQEERLVKAKISDVIERRHNLNDAMEQIFMSDDWRGTYTEALKQSMKATGQKMA